MATYAEIFDLHSNSALRNRVAVACIVKADAIRQLASPTAQQIAWASALLQDPYPLSLRVFWAVLAANNAATVAQITGATDAQLQTAVNNAVDKLFAV